MQVAALAPEPLKAVITLCSTVDRYADDIHYKGGCLLNENLGWGATMWAYSSRPPDPALRENWREMWMQRLEAEPFLPDLWLRHQHRDDYWKHGSICEDYTALSAKVLAVGGWGDAYKNPVFRMLKKLQSYKKKKLEDQKADKEELKKADQLLKLLRKDKFFPRIVEGPITFPPSYKFNRRSNEYDTSKKMRTPSYCDRVLWIEDD